MPSNVSPTMLPLSGCSKRHSFESIPSMGIARSLSADERISQAQARELAEIAISRTELGHAVALA
jgi:hypothetical protein